MRAKELRKYKRGELLKVILRGLALSGFIVSMFALPNISQIAKLFNAKSFKDKKRIRDNLNKLQELGFVKIDHKNGTTTVRITQKGLREVEYEQLSIKKPKKWDGYYRVIMFDIPEEKKMARRAINIKLRELGCYSYQKSIFVHVYDCLEEINFIRDYFKVKNNIKYLVVKEMDDEKKIKKFFKY